MTRRAPLRALAGLAACVFIVAACGDDESAADPTTVETATPPTDSPSTQQSTDSVDPETTTAETSSDDTATTAAAPTTEAETEAETEPAPTDPPGSEAPATQPPATEAPVDTAPPDAPVGGRAFADVRSDAAAYDGNPFPDLVVDDLNRGVKANIANVFPADRPVLVWAWAPH